MPTGASVFGMMQDFVFKDTGLKDRLTLYRSKHPGLVYFGNERVLALLYDNPEQFQRELREKWNEQGNVIGYAADLERLRAFLIEGFKQAKVPTLEDANKKLGDTLTRRWISGSAEELFAHYFTSDRTKIFKSMAVTESGPVPLDGQTTAFNAAIMATGNIWDGNWGYVKGGLWNLPLTLAQINRELGVEIITAAEIQSFDCTTRTFTYATESGSGKLQAEAVFFATDPLTAARIIGDPALLEWVKAKRKLGSSGKVVLFFKEPVRWAGDTGKEDFDAAFRFLYAVDRWEEFCQSGNAVRSGELEFSPCSFQVYCEGGAMRKAGWDEPYDYVSVFTKDFALGQKGRDLPQVKKYTEELILSRIENREAFIGSELFTPRDLQESFFFPEGNIDHIELTEGQNFLARTFSSAPLREFYRLGHLQNIYYCGAGSYPCGSVAGTPGYLAVTQWLRSH